MSGREEKLTLTYKGGGEIIKLSRINEDGLTVEIATEFLVVALEQIYPAIANYLKGFKP